MNDQPFTPQIQAADPTRSVWVSANAGTGKTRVLIDRILRLLLKGVQANRILCLTFTKAAAAEMANRLTETLSQWAILDDNTLKSVLTTLLDQTPDNNEISRAKRLFAVTQDTPDGLKIRTIHSFCESLLGRFPLEANLAPHFSVIDERTAAELRFLTREHVLASPKLSGALDHLAGLVNEADFTSIIQELERNRGRLQQQIDLHGGPAHFEIAAKKLLGLQADDTTLSLLGQAMRVDVSAMKGVADILSQGGKRDQGKAQLINHWITVVQKNTTDIDAFNTYVRAYLKADGEPFTESYLVSQKACKIDAQVMTTMLQEQTRIHALVQQFKALRIIHNTMTLVTIGTALIDAYQTIKQNRASMDYDDLILKTRQLLMTEGQSSWVHFKLDGGIEHILVDEAQDTSPEQWDVIRALADTFFAGSGTDNSDRPLPRTIFAVGDEKQSIYSFQGADPKRFDAMRQYFQNKVQDAQMQWQNVELGLSFRSTQVVLQLVDDVFKNPTARHGLNANDQDVNHQTFRTGQGGSVELWPAEGADDAPHGKDPWNVPLDQISRHDPAAIVCDRISSTIQGWIKTGEQLPSTGRTIRPSDIIILVRTRGQFTERMVRSLKQHDIPVAGSDRMVLGEQLAVMDLIALARFTVLPEDDLNLAVVLKSPFFGLDDDDLLRLAPDRKGTLWQALRDHPDYSAVATRLSGYLTIADYLPPYEFFSHILTVDGGTRDLLKRLGPEAADPVHEFLSITQTFERDHTPSMEGFLSWVEAGDTQIKRDLEQSQGVVRVMTIHGAKGLQANIVFLPDTCSMPKSQHTPGLRFSEQQLDGGEAMFWPALSADETTLTLAIKQRLRQTIEDEYRRLLYVALTRARDRLIISGHYGKKDPDDGCWYALIAAAFEQNADCKNIDLPWQQQGKIIKSTQTAPPDSVATSAKQTPSIKTLPEWAETAPPPEPKRPDPLTPTINEPELRPMISPLDSDDGDIFKRGRLIHQLLQFLPDIDEINRSFAAKTFLSRPAHELTTEQQHLIAHETLIVLNHPDLKNLFQPAGLAEVPIVGEITTQGAKESVIISGQIDRLLVETDQITIVDYKTGRYPPKNMAAIEPSYLRQMALYRAVMRKIYPDKSIRSVLLWTSGPTVMTLDDDVLDKNMPTANA